MAMDQQETFNWLVEEKTRLETELEVCRRQCVNLAFRCAMSNPTIKAQIEREQIAATPSYEIMNLVLSH
jgi:hypothetical protein